VGTVRHRDIEHASLEFEQIALSRGAVLEVGGNPVGSDRDALQEVIGGIVTHQCMPEPAQRSRGSRARQIGGLRRSLRRTLFHVDAPCLVNAIPATVAGAIGRTT
jgi:hypothetical protein